MYFMFVMIFASSMVWCFINIICIIVICAKLRVSFRGSCIIGSSCGVLVDAWLVGTVLEPVLKTLMSWYQNCTLQMKQIRKILNTI